MLRDNNLSLQCFGSSLCEGAVGAGFGQITLLEFRVILGSMDSKLKPLKFFVVNVSDVFGKCAPDAIGPTLAKLWFIDECNLVLLSRDEECLVRLQAIRKAALLCDGSVYEEPAIAQWLQKNIRSPSTNLTLTSDRHPQT